MSVKILPERKLSTNFEHSNIKKLMMTRQILLLLLTVSSLSVRAQFFFGFPQQQVQRQEKQAAPSFKGGKSAMEAFITRNFRQPEERERVDGRIVIAVIVSPKGKPVETHVVRSVNAALDEEAARVCRKMKFKPATQGKKKVKGRIDIAFPVKHGRVTFIDLPTIEV